MLGVLGQIRVLIPGGVRRVIAVGDLHIADARLAHASREQALPAEIVRLRLADAVKCERGRRLPCDVEHLRRMRLHAPGQFVGAHRGFELVIARRAQQLGLIESLQSIEIVALKRR